MQSRSFSFFLRRRRRRRSSRRLSEPLPEPVEDGPGYPVQETWVVDKSGSWVLRLDSYGRPYWYNETLGQWTYQIRKPRGPLPVQLLTPSTDVTSPWLSSPVPSINGQPSPVPSAMSGHPTGLRSSHSHSLSQGQLRGPAGSHSLSQGQLRALAGSHSLSQGQLRGPAGSHNHGLGQLRGPAGGSNMHAGNGAHPMSHAQSSRIKPWNAHFRR